MDDSRAALFDLLDRRRPGEPIETVETHISLLAFQGDRAYKLKKPVTFPFLDLSTIERRRADCEREVALNARMAPDVYLGILPLFGRDGTVVDHVVEMVRLPAARRLATLATTGRDVEGCLERLARDLAKFHEGEPTGGDIDRAATRDAVAELWEMGIAQTHPYEDDVLPGGTASCIATLARRYLAGRDALFEQRIAGGHARDGHGDLLAEDIFCLDDGPRAIDCLEFDDRLRYGDVLADVAFLAMDLERLGRPDLSRVFLDRYRDAAHDAWPRSLEHMYIAYRAHVRAKIACLRHVQGDPDAATEAGSLASTRARSSRGGTCATGARGWAAGVGQVDTRRSDRREARMGRAAQRRGPQGARRSRTRHACRCATGSGSVRPECQRSHIHDARRSGPFVARARGERRARWIVVATPLANHGRRAGRIDVERDDRVPVRRLPADLRRARAGERAALGTDASDAGPELATVLGARFSDWPEATVVDTTSSRDDVAARVIRGLATPRCALVHHST